MADFLDRLLVSPVVVFLLDLRFLDGELLLVVLPVLVLVDSLLSMDLRTH